MRKIIIVFCMFTYNEYKSGISNTNSHIFNWLKNTNPQSEIIFVDFNRFGFYNKLKYYIKHVLLDKSENITQSSFFYKLVRVNERFLIYRGFYYSDLFKYLKKKKEQSIEIWSFNPFIKCYDIKYTNKFFYTIDDWRKNKIFKKYSGYLNERYDNIPDEFTKVFINNKSLKTNLYNDKNNVYFIPNGVDTNHYQNFEQTDIKIKNKINSKLSHTTKRIIGYMGVISPDRVDFELCEYLIKNNPNLLFVFAGPVLSGFNSQLLVTKYDNVKFIGLVYFNELPYLFSKYDVCIIPHKLSEFIQSMDPKKLYEYLAAGKPVVTTPVSGTENFKNIIRITDQKKEFSEFINDSILNDSAIEVSKRKKIASQHDWKFRFEDIESIISV